MLHPTLDQTQLIPSWVYPTFMPIKRKNTKRKGIPQLYIRKILNYLILV